LVTIGGNGRRIEGGNEVVTSRVSEVATYSVERVGLELSLDGFAIQNMSDDPAAVGAALEKAARSKPLIYAATSDNWDKMAELSKQYQCPLAVYEPRGLTELAGLVEQINKAGIEDIILDPGVRGFGDSLTQFTQIRRLALKKSFYLLGYPLISFPEEGAETIEEEVVLCAQHIAKYGGFIVLDHFSPAEVESSHWPGWLLICDTESLSVLTAWSAGKFDAERIAKTVKEFNVSDKISHRSLILPGKVSVLKGELEEELPEGKIMVAPLRRCRSAPI
jgi:acetyl-CoA decarbonylase/synthase complex subunit gamma